MCDILVTERQMPPFRIFSAIASSHGNTKARSRHRLIASGHRRAVRPTCESAILRSSIPGVRFATQKSRYLKFHQWLANVSPQRPGLRLSRSAILGERDNSNRIKTIRKKRPYPFCNQNDARYPRGGWGPDSSKISHLLGASAVSSMLPPPPPLRLEVVALI
jgi:hypothetical protein